MPVRTPVRFSPRPSSIEQMRHDGFIKVRLGHGRFGSVIVPDLIFLRLGSWRFLQPSFFGPCYIGFNVEDGLHIAQFSVDVSSPRANQPTRLLVSFRSDAHVRAYSDGSQLYSCRLNEVSHLAPHASGKCSRLDNGDFGLYLFHHTNSKALTSILAMQELWSSSWNIQGTRRLTNVAYVYFTNLTKIKDEEDLRRIAMASDSIINLQTTSDRPSEETLQLKVYRGSTKERTETVLVKVPSAYLAPAHLHFHPFVSPEPAYYEVVGPEIFRVGLKPGAKLPILRRQAKPAEEDLKHFDYIVLGNASNVEGLSAPYNEEDTGAVMHHERLRSPLDLFQFWLNNANSNQMSDRSFEERSLEPADPAS